MANLVTGDAVTLELRIAGFPSRLLALSVDVALQLAVLFAAAIVVGSALSTVGSQGAEAAIVLCTFVFCFVVLPAMVETLTRGRSLGKMMMGLRVVRDDGGPIRMRHSLVRALAMAFIDLWTTSGVVGSASVLISSRSKRIGDHLAGTIVVGERMPKSTRAGHQTIQMPPQLAWWATTLDLVAIPDGLALNLRTFLTRYPTLDRRTREVLAKRLADDVARHVPSDPPYGTTAVAYLAAIAAERTRRASQSGQQPGTEVPPGPRPTGEGAVQTEAVLVSWAGATAVGRVDIEAFVAAHTPSWRRLSQLVGKRSLTGAEVNELVDNYQRTATQLSLVRSAAPDPALVAHLTQLVAQARSRVTGAHSPAWREFLDFFRVGFPVAVWRARWWCIGSGVFFYLVALLIGAWVARNPDVQAAMATPEQIKQLVNEDFEAYYSSDAASGFAAQVWTNNAWVSAMVLIAGAFFCLPALWVLFQNAVNLGLIGGLMVANGRADLFFGLVLPHGLLELTAVFVAAGAGIRLGWQWIDPGPRPRTVALAQEGRAAVTIALGLVVVLAVSGVIEAFVTPSGLPTWARILIGILALAGFLAFVGIYGRRADRAGQTGDLTSEGAVTELAPMRG